MLPEYSVVIVLSLIALGAVLFPMLVGYQRYASERELDADVERYRAALRDGTLCAHCREASPGGSRFCQQCGAGLR